MSSVIAPAAVAVTWSAVILPAKSVMAPVVAVRNTSPAAPALIVPA